MVVFIYKPKNNPQKINILYDPKESCNTGLNFRSELIPGHEKYCFSTEFMKPGF